MDNHMVYFQLSLIYSLAAKRLGVLGRIRNRSTVLIISQTATETKDRATYQVAIDHVESAKVRSAVGLCRRLYLGN